MKSNELSHAGGAKKFLYTGAKKDQDDQEELPWNFNSKNSSPRATAGQTNGKMKFDMDDVWSIKRNVNIGGKASNTADEKLTYNADKSYYSRYRGGPKDKDDFDSAFGGTNGNGDSNGKSWNTGGQGRRPFSYSQGTDSIKPVSPRNTSNSSTGMYQQAGQNGFSSQTGSGMDYGNSNTNAGTSIYSVPSRNVNSNSESKFGGGGPHYNKTLASSFSVGQTGNTSSRNLNTMFGPSPTINAKQNGGLNSNDLSPTRTSFDGGSSLFNRQNKSFW